MSAPENPAPFDLRLLPSWLKEENSTPSYANFDGEDRPPRGDRRDGGNDRRGPRPSPGGGGNRDGRSREQGNRPSGPRPPQGGNRPPQTGSRPPENRGSRRPEQPDRRSGPPDRRGGNRPPQQQEERSTKVTVTFLPEAIALAKVTEQLQSAPIAYPLFGVAKMFLQRPERHRVEIKPLPEAKLYQLTGTAHFSTDRNRLETLAFQELWGKSFRVDVTEAPEIKGNFVSVARSSLTGKIFGPTSHHTFQTAIHKEYEERFSRRMSFQEYRQSIETTTNPEAIELWKTESRRVETYHLLSPEERAALEVKTPEPAVEVPVIEEAAPAVSEDQAATEVVAPEPLPEIEETAPVVDEAPPEPIATDAPETPVATEAGMDFASKAEAEAYFRSEILPPLIVEVESANLSGQEARNLPDRHLVSAIRLGWEAEMRYPLGLVNQIRVKFTQENLHIFKFKKRVLLISSLKPVYLDEKSRAISTSIRNVLQAIQEHPGIDRKGLAEKIVHADATTSDEVKQTRKNALIGDLYWLIRQGNVIEFSDGTFDLPMGPRAIAAEAKKEEDKPAAVEEAVPAAAESPVAVEQ